MSLAVQHVHHKTRDPQQTVQYYVDNFGAASASTCMGCSSTSPD